MKEPQTQKHLALTALAAGLMLAAMLLVSLLNGGVIAQDFESFADPASYAAEILQVEPSLWN